MKAAIREVLDRFSKHPLINEIIIRRRHNKRWFRVKFKSGITEYWYLSPRQKYKPDYSFFVPNDKPLITRHPIRIYREFETNPLEPNYDELQHYFFISSRDIEKAGFCEVRLKVHEIVDELVKKGWQRFRYPHKALMRDFQNLMDIDVSSYWENLRRLTMYSIRNKEYGKLILSHFNDIGHIRYKDRPTLAESWQYVPLLQTINRLVAHRRDITIHSIVKMLTAIDSSTYISGPRLPNVGVWKTIFVKFGIKSIIDLVPNYGEKAIAAAACNIAYSAKQPSQAVMDIVKFLNIRPASDGVYILTGPEPLSDDVLENHLSMRGNKLAIVTKDQANKYKPAEQYEIRTEPRVLGNIFHVIAYYR